MARHIYILLFTILVLYPCQAQDTNTKTKRAHLERSRFSPAVQEEVTDTHNFSIADGKIIWQYVFEYSGTFEELATSVGSSTSLRVISAKDGTITAEVLPFYSDYKSAGVGKFEVSALILNAKAFGNAIIQYKEGRYRVTVRDIEFQVTSHTMFAGMSGSIEYFALKGKKNPHISESFFTGTAPAIDYELKKKFAFEDSGTRLDDNF